MEGKAPNQRHKALCRHSTTDKYSVAILASGGLLDTLSSIRAGLILYGDRTRTNFHKKFIDGVLDPNLVRYIGKDRSRPITPPGSPWGEMETEAAAADNAATNNTEGSDPKGSWTEVVRGNRGLNGQNLPIPTCPRNVFLREALLVAV